MTWRGVRNVGADAILQHVASWGDRFPHDLAGYVLTFLFAAVSPFWTALAALIMVLFASREVVVRQKRRLQGLWTYGLGAGCTLLAAGTLTTFSLLTQLHPEPWFHPRYAL